MIRSFVKSDMLEFPHLQFRCINLHYYNMTFVIVIIVSLNTKLLIINIHYTLFHSIRVAWSTHQTEMLNFSCTVDILLDK